MSFDLLLIKRATISYKISLYIAVMKFGDLTVPNNVSFTSSALCFIWEKRLQSLFIL